MLLLLGLSGRMEGSGRIMPVGRGVPCRSISGVRVLFALQVLWNTLSPVLRPLTQRRVIVLGAPGNMGELKVSLLRRDVTRRSRRTCMLGEGGLSAP